VSQQINLYNPTFEKRRELLSLAGMLGIWGAALVLMAAAWGLASLRADAAAKTLQSESAATAAAQAEMQRLAAQVAARRGDPALAAALARLETELAGRNEVMQTLSGGVIGNTRGFSEYLRAFARQSFEGLWLTGLSVAGAGQDVVLEGRALRPELVPSYVQRLNREQIMKGHAFAELQMRRPEPEPGPERVREMMPFIEFRLATLAGAESAKGGAKP